MDEQMAPKAPEDLNNHPQTRPGRRRSGIMKWLCCVMQPAGAKADSPIGHPGTVYPEECVHLEAQVDTYECECCCFEAPFEKLVQCADGHLFCFTCLKRRIEESTFGVAPANGPLACMYMGGCEKLIPWLEIQRGIDKGLLSKFEQRQAADDVAHAQIPGMFYCPACNLGCVVDSSTVVFECPSEQCGKATCIKCGAPRHEGPCVEAKEITVARTNVEEIMSKSLVRECKLCKAEIIKDLGCNKITCRCGMMMCYTCREQIKGYDHFCKHTGRRCKDATCKICGQCRLLYEENSDEIVKAAMKGATERGRRKTLLIGPVKTR